MGIIDDVWGELAAQARAKRAAERKVIADKVLTEHKAASAAAAAEAATLAAERDSLAAQIVAAEAAERQREIHRTEDANRMLKLARNELGRKAKR